MHVMKQHDIDFLLRNFDIHVYERDETKGSVADPDSLSRIPIQIKKIDAPNFALPRKEPTVHCVQYTEEPTVQCTVYNRTYCTVYNLFFIRDIFLYYIQKQMLSQTKLFLIPKQNLYL